MTTANLSHEEKAPSEITRAPLGVVATWVTVFAFGAAFWAFVFHVAPVVARHVYHGVRAEEFNAGVHPWRFVRRITAQGLSDDRSA
jgi:hypothetical protein